MQQRDIRTVGLVGAGIMGAPIARHVMDAGYDLVVFTRTRESAQGLLERGAAWAATPGDVAASADVVLTMVGYPSDVEEVYLASDGLLAHARPGTWLIDLTTSSPQLARELHDAAAVTDVHAFDCPVTGGQAGAQAGTLTLIAGISEEDAAPVLPVLQAFSSRIFYFGVPGAGQTAKLCNQVSLAGAMVGMAEALALAQQGGIDAELMLEMVGSGMGGSRAISDLAPKALDGDWAPGFLCEHFRKDLALALELGEEEQLQLPGAETAHALYDLLCRTGGERLGSQAIALCYQDEASGVAAGLDWGMLEDEPPQDDECCHHHGDGECCHRHHH